MLQRPRRPHLKRRVSAGLNQSSANGSRRPRECRLPKASRSQHSRNLRSSNQQVCAHSSAHSFHLLSLRLHICSHSNHLYSLITLLTFKSSAALSHIVRCLRCSEVVGQPIQKRNGQVVEEFHHLRRVAYGSDQGSCATLGIRGAGSRHDRDILPLVRGCE